MAKRRFANIFKFGRKLHEAAPDGLHYTHFPPEVTSLLRMYGVGGSYGALYARQPNVRMAVDIIAREAAELQLKMYEKDPRGDSLPSSRIELEDHRMMQVLHEPTPGTSSYRFWFSLFSDICIYDRALWQKIRQNGVPAAIVRVPPALLLPVYYNSQTGVYGPLDHWRSAGGQEIPKEDIVAFWGYDPQVNEGSISPLETLRRLLADEVASGDHREMQWRTGLRKDGIIERASEAPQMSDEARESFMIDVEDSLAGSAGRPLMLEPGMTWKDITWSSRDMEYLGARKLSRVEVAASYHIPAAMMMALEGQDPDEATLKFFYKSTLPPYLSRVESDIVAQLLPDFDKNPVVRRARYVRFNLDAKLRGSPEEQAAIMATAAGGPVITVNEARARLNLPAIEGGDLIFVPLNSIRAGGPQGSPGAPVATPATGVEPAGTTPGGGTVQQASLADVLSGNAIAIGGSQKAPRLVTDTDDIAAMLKGVEDKRITAKRNAEHERFMLETSIRFEERHARVVERAFERMRNAVIGGKGFNRERWDKEFGDDLFGVGLQTVEKFGTDVAERVGGAWRTERTAAYVRTRADAVAKNINGATEKLLAVEDTTLNDVFTEARIQEIAVQQTTYWKNWAVMEATRQSEY